MATSLATLISRAQQDMVKPTMSDTKTCTRCELTKPRSEFGRDKRSPGGLCVRCKACRREEANANYAARGHERVAKIKAWRDANVEKMRAYRRAWRERNREAWLEMKREEYRSDPAAHRRETIMRKYGLTPEAYEEMVWEQEDRCAICGTDDKGNGRSQWSIDHDHVTGKVRGLLCHPCNVGIGHLKESPAVLLAAERYLQSHRAPRLKAV